MLPVNNVAAIKGAKIRASLNIILSAANRGRIAGSVAANTSVGMLPACTRSIGAA